MVENRVALAKPVLPDAVLRIGVASKAEAAEPGENRVTVTLVDRGAQGWDTLRRFSEAVLKRLSADGSIVKPNVFPDPDEKRVDVKIDPVKIRRYGVSLADVSKAFWAADSRNLDAIRTLHVRSASGDAISLGTLATVGLVNGPSVYRVDMYSAVRITGSPPEGSTPESAPSRCAELADAERRAQNDPAPSR